MEHDQEWDAWKKWKEVRKWEEWKMWKAREAETLLVGHAASGGTADPAVSGEQRDGAHAQGPVNVDQSQRGYDAAERVQTEIVVGQALPQALDDPRTDANIGVADVQPSEVKTRYVLSGQPTGWAAMPKVAQDFDQEKIQNCKEDIDTLLVFVSEILGGLGQR